MSSRERGRVVRPRYHTVLPLATSSFHFLYPHCLDVRELSYAVNSYVPPVSRPLHSSERDSWIRSHHLVYKNHSCFQVVDEALALFRIIGPGTCPQSKPAVICDADRVIDPFRAEHARHRTE